MKQLKASTIRERLTELYTYIEEQLDDKSLLYDCLVALLESYVVEETVEIYFDDLGNLREDLVQKETAQYIEYTEAHNTYLPNPHSDFTTIEDLIDTEMYVLEMKETMTKENVLYRIYKICMGVTSSYTDVKSFTEYLELSYDLDDLLTIFFDSRKSIREDVVLQRYIEY